MSELITRRTFLKATGAAVLVTAAGGLLAGCSGGTDDLLNVSTLPSVSSESYISADTGYLIGLGSFEGCRSNSLHESSGVQHYYLYTAVSFQNVTTTFTLKTSDFKFKFDNSKLTSTAKSASSLGNYTLDSSTDKYKAASTREVSTGNSTVSLWVDLGSYIDVPTNHIGSFTVTYKNSVIFRYASPSDTPSTEQVNKE